MALIHPPYRPRRRLGAEFDQTNVPRGVRQAAPPVGLSTGAAHDWSAFDAFKAAQPGARMALAPVAAGPSASIDPFRVAAARAASNINAGVGAAPSLPRPMAGALRATAGAVNSVPAPAARPTAQPITPVMQNEIPGRFTDTGGVENSYTTAGGVQERGYDPTKDQSRPGVTAVDPFNRNNWTRTVAIDPRYGGGVGTGTNGAGYAAPTVGDNAGRVARGAMNLAAGPVGTFKAAQDADAFGRGVQPMPTTKPIPHSTAYNAGQAVGAAPGKAGDAVAGLMRGAWDTAANAGAGFTHATVGNPGGDAADALNKLTNVVTPQGHVGLGVDAYGRPLKKLTLAPQ